MILIIALSCVSSNPELLAEYTAARRAALTLPDAAPPDWNPDAVLMVSADLVDQLVQAGLRANGPWTDPIPVRDGIRLEPNLSVTTLDLTATARCEDCVAAEMILAGPVLYRAGPLSGTIEVTVEAELVFGLSTKPVRRAFGIDATVRSVERVQIDLGGLPRSVVGLVDDQVREWVETELIATPPTTLAVIGGKEIPLRSLQVHTAQDKRQRVGLRADLLTRATAPEALATIPAMPRRGWRLAVSTASVVSIARTEAFRQTPISPLGVIPVPEALAVTENTFDLDLRIWRPAEPVWWRDVRVQGSVDVAAGSPAGSVLALRPTGAEPQGASPGAGLADPLALLAQGVILDEITKALTQTLPASAAHQVEGARFDVDVDKLTGASDGRTVTLHGNVAIEDTP